MISLDRDWGNWDWVCSTGKRERLPEVCGWKDEVGEVEGEKVEG